MKKNTNYFLSDTIAAVATSFGDSGIGIVRMSGPEALTIAEEVFSAKSGVSPLRQKTFTVLYGWISDRAQTPAYIIDEALLTVMRAPRSFTKEDVVEISCHGGMVVLRSVLELVIRHGARLALPGEFTRRAFLNGRIDLSQAEAVLDIIRAKTDAALKVGAQQLKGGVSREIANVRGVLIEAASILEAHIDFPDDAANSFPFEKIRAELFGARQQILTMIEKSRQGRVLREGVSAVICGRPNVGKSSLLNALLKKERSIVTPFAGTTRDTIEEIIDIKGIPVKIADTAGILKPRNLIEKKAVSRSKKHIAAADLVILLFDGSMKINSQDRTLMRLISKKPCVAVINKIDLPQRIEGDELENLFPYCVKLSAKKAKNIGVLEGMIFQSVLKGRVFSQEPTLISNMRHIHALNRCEKLIEEAVKSMDNRLSLEFIAFDVKEALGCLDDILGKRFSEEMLDKIFSDFCIGK